MPNWCDNTLIVRGNKAKLKRFLAKVTNGDGEFTFGKTVPRPIELDITSGTLVNNAVDIINASEGKWEGIDKMLRLPAWAESAGIKPDLPIKEQRERMLAYMKKKMPESYMQEGRQYIKNIKKYGCGDWYEWNVKNWGTKWDACESTISNEGFCVSISFQTAWSPPIEWLKKTELKFPDLSFVLYYDEPGMGFRGFYSNRTNNCPEY